jgi:hypothetical protein
VLLHKKTNNKKKRKHQFWIHALFSARQERGMSYTAFRDLRNDGDEAFGLSTNLLQPYGGKNLSKRTRMLTYHLCRARRFIECILGILSNEWRILHGPLNVFIDFAEDIVRVCCVLHNFVHEEDGYNFDQTLCVEGQVYTPNSVPQQAGRSASYVRYHFANLSVSSEGEVHWQYDEA